MSHERPSSFVSQEPFTFSGRGTVWSFTIIDRNHAPQGFEEYAPYVNAIIQLEEGPLLMAQLTDTDFRWETDKIDGEERSLLHYNFDNIKIGMPVEGVIRRLKRDTVDGDPNRGLIIYGLKFRPVFWQPKKQLSG